MFRVLVYYENAEVHIDDNGDECWHAGYIYRDIETEEEMEEYFSACSKALIEKINEHKESFGTAEVLKGEKEDFECEREISIRTLRYCNTCSEQIDADSMKSDIDVWGEAELNGYRAKLEGINGMVNEIQLM